MTDVAVVDYGMGNLRSVAKAIEHVAPRLKVAVTSDRERGEPRGARGVPGPGRDAGLHARDGRARAARGGARRGARQAVSRHLHRPADAVRTQRGRRYARAWGCCRGGCGAFPAEKMVDAQGARLKVPHMGWNEVRQTVRAPAVGGHPAGQPLLFRAQLFPRTRAAAELTAGESVYGVPFTCAAARDNVFAVQFHPEKSEAAGLRLLANFVAWQPAVPAPAADDRVPGRCRRHADHSRDRPEGRQVRAPEAGRDGQGHRVFRRSRRRWPSTGSSSARGGCTSST